MASGEDIAMLKKQLAAAQAKSELYEQENYTLKRDLSLKVMLEGHYNQEIQNLQTIEMDLQTKLKNSSIAHNDSLKRAQEKVEMLEQLIMERDRQIKGLRKNVNVLEVSKLSVDDELKVVKTENERLKQAQHDLLDQRDNLESELQIDMNAIVRQDETYERLKQDFEDMELNYNKKKLEVIEGMSLIQKLRSEKITLECELDFIKNKPLCDNSQGNSMFAEVNERRLQLETSLKKMQMKYEKVANERSILLHRMNVLQREVKCLRNHWEDDHVKLEKDALAMEQNMEKFSTKLISIVQAVQEDFDRRIMDLSITGNPPGMSEAAYLRCMLETRKQEEYSLLEQIKHLLLVEMSQIGQLKEANRTILRLEALVSRLEVELVNLKVKTGLIIGTSAEETVGNVIRLNDTKDEVSKNNDEVNSSSESREQYVIPIDLTEVMRLYTMYEIGKYETAAANRENLLNVKNTENLERSEQRDGQKLDKAKKAVPFKKCVSVKTEKKFVPKGKKKKF